MQVAILAGGLATRLGSLTKEQPKSLVRILDRPFLAYQLQNAVRSGVNDVVMCVGHLGDQIENHFGDGHQYEVNIQYSYDGDKLLGTAGSLKKAETLLEDPFFVMYGDSYLALDFKAIMADFTAHNKQAMMVVYKNFDQYDRSNCVVENNCIKCYSKTETIEDMVYIDYGASILRKSTLDFVPQDEVFSLQQLFSVLVNDQQMLAYETKERFYEIGSPMGLNEFHEYMTVKEGI
ncbi:MAG: NTP transferase domain-containing protein [Chloroflexi bacterium]|nr:NTP transferase domain-containing protein [Chloroflexota bacterium]